MSTDPLVGEYRWSIHTLPDPNEVPERPFIVASNGEIGEVTGTCAVDQQQYLMMLDNWSTYH